MRITVRYGDRKAQAISDAMERDWANHTNRQEREGKPILHLYRDGEEIGNAPFEGFMGGDDVIADWCRRTGEQVKRSSAFATVRGVDRMHHGCEVEA